MELKKFLIIVPLQVNLNVSLLEDIEDDMDFCVKLSKEESVIILPGKKQRIWVFEVSLTNWEYENCKYYEKMNQWYAKYDTLCLQIWRME